MATAEKKPAPVVAATSESTGMLKILLPYLVAIGVQLPMLFLYFRNLWGRPHYQTFVFAIIAVIAIAWSRWPRENPMPFHKSFRANFFMVLGLLMGMMGILFLESWFHAASVFLLIMSFLSRTLDQETGKSMWAVALPLFVFLQLPLGYDYRLITWLQRVSAIFTSRLLDLINYGHHMPGTVIQVPGREAYGIEQACSGVQSFFTLLFVAVVFIVWNRRPWFRALLLVVAAVFWAIFMNTLRIFMIPLADRMMGLDLAHGFAHDVLGWSVMTLGILLLFSTDQFLLFMFGPVEPETGKAGPFGTLITNIWNGVIAGDSKENEDGVVRRKRKTRQPISKIGRSLMWGTAGVMALLTLWQVADIYRSFNAPRNLKVKFFDSDMTIPYAENDLPKEIDSWTMVNYTAEDRKRGSDLGLRSDTWSFESPRCSAVASLDQTFPGWHELTTCYRNQGWTLVSRQRKNSKTVDSEGNEFNWPYIEALFEKPTGEKGFLLFSHFDAFGKPFDAPAEWGTVNSFFIRARNRLSHKIRARLFRGEAYQTQVFLASFGEFSEPVKEEAKDHYLKIRELMRQGYIAKKTNGVPVSPEQPENIDPATP